MKVPDELKSKHGGEGEQEQGSQSIWVVRPCMATSMLVCFLLWGMTSTRRTPKARAEAVSKLRTLAARCAAVIPQSQFTFEIQPFPGGPSQSLCLDSGLLVPGSAVWPLDARHKASARFNWDRLRMSETSSIQSHFDSPHLVDLLLFGLDKTNPSNLMVLSMVTSLVTQLAYYIDDKAPEFAEGGLDSMRKGLQFKSRKDNKARTKILRCHTAMLLWHGEEANDESLAT